MTLALVGAKLITPFRIIRNGAVVIERNQIMELGTIEDVVIPKEAEIIDVSGKAILPGFIDLLNHGALGRGFSEGNEEDFEIISNHFLQHGTTTMLASLYGKPQKELLDQIYRLGSYIKSHPESNIKGIHLEGPYLNKEFKGAMNEDWLWEPTVDSWEKMWRASLGTVKFMTIAPELPGALEVIREAAKRGVVISIGHSKATYKEMEAAIDNGATQITHMFNAMSPLHHRKPGVALAALLRDELMIHLIGDTYHVHPATMELLLKVKQPHRIILITDSIAPGGMHEGEESMFANQPVRIKGGKAMLDNGTIAGSSLTLNIAVKNMVEKVGARIMEAARMATTNPARALGLEREFGVLAVGKQADMLVMGDDYSVDMTIMNGEIVYSR